MADSDGKSSAEAFEGFFISEEYFNKTFLKLRQELSLIEICAEIDDFYVIRRWKLDRKKFEEFFRLSWTLGKVVICSFCVLFQESLKESLKWWIDAVFSLIIIILQKQPF